MPATDVLRERTAATHAALDGSDFIRPALRDRDRFGRLVAAMLAFHQAVEREMTRFAFPLGSFGIDVASHAKAHLLAQDAAALDGRPIPEPAFALVSPGEAAGAFYVLEGSTLGGLVLASEVRRHLGFDSRYYGAYGRETAARWRATRAGLDRIGRDASTLDAMITGAERTFDTLHGHLRTHVARRSAVRTPA